MENDEPVNGEEDNDDDLVGEENHEKAEKTEEVENDEEDEDK